MDSEWPVDIERLLLLVFLAYNYAIIVSVGNYIVVRNLGNILSPLPHYNKSNTLECCNNGRPLT